MKKSFLTITGLLIIAAIVLFKFDNHFNKEASLDYSNSTNWISQDTVSNKDVDVFYVYPTIFGETEIMNMDVTNDSLRRSAQIVAGEQGGVFIEHCNFFAPYYRQMSMAGLDDSPLTNPYFIKGYNDVKAAFRYYLKNLNHGRPFILAGHSQGTMVLIELMKDTEKVEIPMDKLVAAYLIGYSVTSMDTDSCSRMKIAQHAAETGAIITYNTQSDSATDSPVLLQGAQCVNPLSWTTTADTIPREKNKGAVVFNDSGTIVKVFPAFTNAWIDENHALVAGTPDPDYMYSIDSAFSKGVYHKYDYNFFYYNLKENVETRIKAYFNQSDPEELITVK